jgi:hypothetical protein
MIHRQDGSLALYLVNSAMWSDGHFEPSITRLPELTDPGVTTALTITQPANEGGRFLEWLYD